MNSKLPPEDRMEPRLTDYVFTEYSIKKGFKAIFEADCDIFTMLLYIKASGSRDFCRLNIMDFFNLFRPLLVSLKFRS